MGIDRIGGKGPLPGGADAASSTSSADKATEASKPFAVNPSRTEGASGSSGVQGAAADPLARLRAGEIDAHAYVELKVDEATRGLKGLGSEQLETIRSELRHRMAADPALADLVQQATGTRLSIPEE